MIPICGYKIPQKELWIYNKIKIKKFTKEKESRNPEIPDSFLFHTVVYRPV